MFWIGWSKWQGVDGETEGKVYEAEKLEIGRREKLGRHGVRVLEWVIVYEIDEPVSEHEQTSHSLKGYPQVWNRMLYLEKSWVGHTL